jgi:basic membrane protein A and related proteins
VAVYNAFKGVQPGVTTLGLKEGGLDLAFDDNNAKLVSAEMRKRVDVAKAFIISGKIKVVDYTVAKSCR